MSLVRRHKNNFKNQFTLWHYESVSARGRVCQIVHDFWKKGVFEEKKEREK